MDGSTTPSFVSPFVVNNEIKILVFELTVYNNDSDNSDSDTVVITVDPVNAPTGDQDSDGIPDNVDQCPTAMETSNQLQDDDGCPDIDPSADSDNDGIVDNLDFCPNQHETFNGFQDDDGCPDTLPSVSTTGMLSDGTVISIRVSEPMSGEMMWINVEFADSEHVNHDIRVTQNDLEVLNDKGAHHHDGKGVHTTVRLGSSDPVDIL